MSSGYQPACEVVVAVNTGLYGVDVPGAPVGVPLGVPPVGGGVTGGGTGGLPPEGGNCTFFCHDRQEIFSLSFTILETPSR